jgi:hypothetical protein
VHALEDRRRLAQVASGDEEDDEVGRLAVQADARLDRGLDGRAAGLAADHHPAAHAHAHRTPDSSAASVRSSPRVRARALRPDRRRQDGRRDRARRPVARPRRAPRRGLGDALQVYQGLEVLTGAATPAEQARLEHRLISFLPVDARFSVGEYAGLAHAEIDELLAKGRGRSSSAAPACTCGLRSPSSISSPQPPPRSGRAGRPNSPSTAPRRCTRSWPAAPRGRPRRSTRATAAGLVRAHELLDLGELEPPQGDNRLWTDDTRHPTR